MVHHGRVWGRFRPWFVSSILYIAKNKQKTKKKQNNNEYYTINRTVTLADEVK